MGPDRGSRCSGTISQARRSSGVEAWRVRISTHGRSSKWHPVPAASGALPCLLHDSLIHFTPPARPLTPCLAVTQRRAGEPARGPRARTPTPCDRFPVGSRRVVRRPLATRKPPPLRRPQSVSPAPGSGRNTPRWPAPGPGKQCHRIRLSMSIEPGEPRLSARDSDRRPARVASPSAAAAHTNP